MAGQEMIAYVVGIVILLYALKVIINDKAFGKFPAKVAKFIAFLPLRLIKAIFKK